jgi:hypothetical protein
MDSYTTSFFRSQASTYTIPCIRIVPTSHPRYMPRKRGYMFLHALGDAGLEPTCRIPLSLPIQAPIQLFNLPMTPGNVVDSTFVTGHSFFPHFQRPGPAEGIIPLFVPCQDLRPNPA